MSWNVYDYPEPRGFDETPEPHCPRCGNICEKVFRYDGEIVCCDECIEWEDAFEFKECFDE